MPPENDEFDNDEILETNDKDLEIDFDSDRNFEHQFIGCKIRAFSVNGWFVRTVTWYNSKMRKLHIV